MWRWLGDSALLLQDLAPVHLFKDNSLLTRKLWGLHNYANCYKETEIKKPVTAVKHIAVG